ncbi:MAG: hypothetical protein IPM00_06825 [Tetrasphaera sp.]|nr:hypothetical protein [Tetrasphaera sp.]
MPLAEQRGVVEFAPPVVPPVEDVVGAGPRGRPVTAGVGAVLVAAHQLATLGPVEQAGLTALVEVLALGAQDVRG